jgi:hypothetical protein
MTITRSPAWATAMARLAAVDVFPSDAPGDVTRITSSSSWDARNRTDVRNDRKASAVVDAPPSRAISGASSNRRRYGICPSTGAPTMARA